MCALWSTIQKHLVSGVPHLETHIPPSLSSLCSPCPQATFPSLYQMGYRNKAWSFITLAIG